MSWHADVITLFPELFPGPLGASVLGRGLGESIWSLKATNLRDFAVDKYRTVDDTPAGGGPGMVLKADILATAIDAVSPADDRRPRLVMSPRGTPLTQAKARELATGPGVVIVCGRFEGVDERAIEARGLTEISIGDYVLAGGEVAAMVLMDPAAIERAAREMGLDPSAIPGLAEGAAAAAPPKTMVEKLPTDVGKLLGGSPGLGGASRFPSLPGLGGGFVPRKK